MPTKTGAPNLFSTSNRGSLKVTRNAKIGTAFSRPPAALTPEFRIIDQDLVLLLITEMEALGYDIAQVIGMRPRLAFCVIKLCFSSGHRTHSF